MENNPLLEVLNTSNNEVYDVTDKYLRTVDIEDFKAHILDLLDRQRQKCAEEATMVFIDRDNDINEQSITNAKLI